MHKLLPNLMGVAAALALIATDGGPAAAGGRDRGYGYYGQGYYGHGYGGDHRWGYGGSRHGHGDRWYGHGKRHGYHGGYRPRHYPRHYHHHHNGTGKFVLGAATGLLLGTVIANSQTREREVVYVPRYDYGGPRYDYGASSPPRYAPQAGRQMAFSQEECLQIREYTTTITIAGREEEGYGDACLQSDGSWLQGPVKIAPR